MQNNTPNVEELSLNLSNESTSRKEADNSLKILISNELALFATADSINLLPLLPLLSGWVITALIFIFDSFDKESRTFAAL